MIKYGVVFSVLAMNFLLSTAFGGVTSERWIQFASKSPKHKELHHHIFYKNLKHQQFGESTLQVFFSDRVYFMKHLEARLHGNLKKLTTSAEFNIPKEILFRSDLYEKELLLLLPDRTWKTSASVKEYVDYLTIQDEQVVLLHYLIHIAGEPFGAQIMSKQIQRKFSQLGSFIFNLGQLNGKELLPSDAKEIIHTQVADQFFPDSRYESGELMTDDFVKEQLEQVFTYASQMFTAAVEAGITAGEASSSENPTIASDTQKAPTGAEGETEKEEDGSPTAIRHCPFSGDAQGSVGTSTGTTGTNDGTHSTKTRSQCPIHRIREGLDRALRMLSTMDHG